MPLATIVNLGTSTDSESKSDPLIDCSDAEEIAQPIAVLVIEDDEVDYYAVERLLRDVGGRRYAVSWVSTSAHGRKALAEGGFDICIVDNRLDGSDGLSLIREAQASGNLVPCILLTGQYSAEIDDAAIRAGAMGLLEKGALTAHCVDRTLRHCLELHTKQSRLEALTYVDELTSLPNRRRFGELLGDANIRAKLSGTPLGLIIADIDNFRDINTSAGYDVGDALLRRIGRRLSTCLGPDDILGRIGGNTFAALIAQPDNSDFMKLTAEKMLRAIDEQIDIRGFPLRVNCSIGIDFYLPSTHEPTVFANAEAALYAAKANRRGGYQLFNTQLRERVERRAEIARDMRIALDQNEMMMAYQPIVNASSGETVAFEALLRWRRDDGSFVSPDDFISVAEDTGFIVALGDWVLHQAAAHAARLRAAGTPTRVHVNISPKQLRERMFVEMVDNALDVNGTLRSDIVLEVTESVLMDDFDACIAGLEELQASGLQLSIDDFGTGHSSLAYIQRIPVDSIKIDRSFVASMLTDDRTAKIVSIIVDLGRTIGVSVVAEGVETGEQATYLTTLGCDELQGYYFGRPEFLDPHTHGSATAESPD